jgi:RNA-directed DNA polymerase
MIALLLKDPDAVEKRIKQMRVRHEQRRKDIDGRLKSLWLRQEGICPICKQMIQPEEEWVVHHVVAQSLEGKDTLDNLRLLHGNCHRLVHVKHEISALPALS